MADEDGPTTGEGTRATEGRVPHEAQHPTPTFSVVIPTTGQRPELARAIQTVRDQTLDAVEVVLVVDGDDDALPQGLSTLADVTVTTGGRRGGGHARNLGVETASGRFVAFLDDDDTWSSDKLERQLQAFLGAADPEHTVVATRHRNVDIGSGAVSKPYPSALARPGVPLAEYLFRRRRPGGGRPTIYTSTLACARSLALSIPWASDLPRHQDWDWMIRLDRSQRVEFVHLEQPLALVQVGSASSISASPDWRSSLSWADVALRDDPPVYADFVTAQPLRYALSARSLRGAGAVLRRLASVRRLPTPGPLAIGLSGLLPRTLIQRLMVRWK